MARIFFPTFPSSILESQNTLNYEILTNSETSVDGFGGHKTVEYLVGFPDTWASELHCKFISFIDFAYIIGINFVHQLTLL